MALTTELTAKRRKAFSAIEILIIIGLALVPLLTSFPYRVNIFLSWEGAYRMSQGQIPYKDFGMPLGYMYWVIPSIFFKIFGTQMITLIKAQVFINIISGLAFRSILKSLDVQPGIRLLSVLLYCISFSFFNFWPWYNHTVIVYEMIGLAFLMNYLFWGKKKWSWLKLSLSALFIFFSFFTKQDGGGLAFILCIALLLYHSINEKEWKSMLIYISSFVVIAFAIIAPLTQYNFSYWFNHGQPPHTARLSIYEISDEFLYGSQWIKFYLLMVIVLAMAYFKSGKQILSDKKTTLFLLLTLGILAEAAIFQVTSYTPPDNNIFFHSFAFVFILGMLAQLLNLNFSSLKILIPGCALLLVWWSGVFWKYIQRVIGSIVPEQQTVSATGENIVNRKTYMLLEDTTEIPMWQWQYTRLRSFEKISMPGPTVDGIHRLIDMPLVKQNKNLQVLNLTELTPLSVELPYKEETGPQIPLWHHLGVGMFNKEAAMYERKIVEKKYDLVLFEYISTLNNFFPFRIRDTLQNHYHKIDSFPAPRRGETRGVIEIYVRPQ